METPPPPLPPPSRPELKKSTWALIGASVGVLGASLMTVVNLGDPLTKIGAISSIGMMFLLPPVAVVLTIFKPTRSFGLGLLLACGVCWLVELAICGGVAAFG